MITARIIGTNGKPLKINGEGEISVVVHPHPPIDEDKTSFPFRQYFTTTGSTGGSTDMRVNGSSTAPIEFYIKASATYDTWIKSISIKLADTSATLDKFGALAVLTNGVEFSWSSQKEGVKIIHDGIKDNLEFFRLSSQSPTLVDLAGGGADSIVVTIDLSDTFGTPYGVLLRKETLDKLSFKVRDNISAGLNEFNIIGYGIQI